MMQSLEGRTVLVTGANGGLGEQFVRQAVERGARKVYAASKAAMWSATNALRFALQGQGTQVVGLLVGMVDTPMSARRPKNSIPACMNN
jgi:NAD(P)-dependent dehydrogenase (short-subunit alcohol dehydrogenase family)